jgi:Abortive infection alpha
MTEDLVGAGKAADALERGTRELREVARDLVGPLTAEIGHYFADQFRIFRFRSAVRAVGKAKDMVAAAGLSIHPIDLRRLVPLLEGASLEEDDDLVSKWAGLIATAAVSTDTLPAFADILRQLTPEEARMLDFIFDNFGRVPGFVEQYVGVDKAVFTASFRPISEAISRSRAEPSPA